MNRLIRQAWAIGLAIWLTGIAIPTMAQPVFPPHTAQVLDQGRLLSPERERALERRLATLQAGTGDQLAVVTVSNLQGLSIEDYGYQLRSTWGLGQIEQGGAALLIVAPTERMVRIEVSHGLDAVLTDAVAARIIQDEILPAFRVGGFERGIDQGVDALIAHLTLDREDAVALAAAAERAPPRLEWGVPIIMGAMIVLGVLAAAGSAREMDRQGRRFGGASRGWR